MFAKVPVTIVTGFLGSGKTTNGGLTTDARRAGLAGSTRVQSLQRGAP